MGTRQERVVLTLDDQFTTRMARAAGATALLNRELHDLDGTSVETGDSVREVGDDIERTDEKSRRADQSINQLTGRLAVLRDVALTLGPALVPLGAGAVGGLAGIAAQAGAAAGGVAVTIAAFSGLGDALDAVNDYQLEPTADNLAAMRLELEKVGPDAARFAMFLQEIEPELRSLQMTARAGIFPGLEAGIETLLTRGPQLESIVTNIAEALGDMAEATGEGLGGERFNAFFDYIESEAGPTLRELGNSIGFVTEGLANLMVAFTPVSSDFSFGLQEMTRSFAEWSRTLDDNASFQEFVDYVRANGPAALDFLGSLIGALASFVQAAAPVGEVVLPMLTKVLDLFSAIAGTDVGTTLLAGAAGLAAWSRGAKIAEAATRGLNVGVLGSTAAVKSVTAAHKAATPTLSQFGTVLLRAGQSAEYATKQTIAARQAVAPFRAAMGQAAAAAGVLAVSMTDVDEKIGLSNTAMGAMAGFMIGGPWGAAIGGGIGLARDFAVSNDDVSDALDRVTASLEEARAGLSTFDTSRLTSEVDAARDAVEELERRVNSGDLGDALVGTKDLLDQWWGFTTDLEEAQQRLVAAEAESEQAIRATKAAAAEAAADRSYYEWVQAQTRALEANIAAMRAKREEALRGENAELDYASAVLDAKDAVKENGRNLNENTRAGIDNRRALVQLASAWNNQSDAAKNADGAHKQARQTFVAVAQQMGMNAEKARAYADELMEIPPKRETKIQLETSVAMQQIRAVRSELDSLRDKTITVGVRRVNAGGFGPQVGAGFSSGGYTGHGGKYEPAGIVHRDEVVLPKEVVRRDGRFLKSRYGFLPGMADLPGYADGGRVGPRFGPNNPLSGIGRDFLSANELGVRLSNLTLRQLAAVGADMERLGKGPLAKLAKALEKASDLAEDELEASKRKLDALRDERDSIAATVEARLKTADLFGQAGESRFSMTRPENWASLPPEQQAAFLRAQWSVGQSMGYGQSQSPVEILRADLARAREEREMIQRLRRRGLSGDALQYAIEADGGLSGALELSRRELKQFEVLYDKRDRVAGAVGDLAGNAVLGQEIRQQTREVRRQTDIVQAIRQEDRDTNRRLERIEKILAKAPRETGDAVGDAVNNAAAGGQRRRS